MLGIMDGIRNCYGRRLVAVSPILQEYDASTVAQLVRIPPQSNLWKW